MNNVEERLHAAAEETRQLARKQLPGPFVQQTTRARPRGWLVFAAAFAVVVVTFGVIPWLASNTPNAPMGNGSTPSPMNTLSPSNTTTRSTVATTTPEVSCSSDGVPLPEAAVGLPAEVTATRGAIIGEVSNCDLAGLRELGGKDFRTSYGGGGAENLAIWEDQGEGHLGALLRLLDMSYGIIETEDGAIYVWPAAATYESWDAIPEEQVDELTAIYTEEELDMLAEFGSYIGWRTGVDQGGNWLYFIAGD